MKKPNPWHKFIQSVFIISMLSSGITGDLTVNEAAVAIGSNKSISSNKTSKSAISSDLCWYKADVTGKRICILEVEAQQAQQSGNFDEAIRLLQEAYSYAEKHVFWDNFWNSFWGRANIRPQLGWKMDELSIRLGDIYYKIHNYNKAIEKYKEASKYISQYSELDTRLIDLYIKLGVSLYNIDNLKDAELEAEKALRVIDIVIKSTEYSERSYSSQFIPVGASIISDQYREIYLLLQRIYVKRNQAEKALEYSERGRSLGLISLLSAKDDPFTQFQPPNYEIKKLQYVAKSQKATLVEYSIVDSKTLFIYVIQPTGAFHSRIIALDTLEKIRKNLRNKSENQFDYSKKTLLVLLFSIVIIAIRLRALKSFRNFLLPSIIIILVIAGGQIILHSLMGFPNLHQESFQKLSRQNRLSSKVNQLTFRGVTKETLLLIRGKGDPEVPKDLTRQGCKDDNECLQVLYQVLIQPIQSLLPKDPTQHIVFFPDMELYQVPFAALMTLDGKYLIEDHTIRIFPSIQSLDMLQKRENSDDKPEKRALVVGNPLVPQLNLINTEVAEELRSLPFAEKEAQFIGQLLGEKPLVGKQATEANVLKQIRRARIIHFATHAIRDVRIRRPRVPQRFKRDESFPRDRYYNENISLYYPKRLSAIVLTPSRNDDGLLDEVEIYDLQQMQADLVVLSACNSGIGDITTDGVINLARPFISNGVPSVVVSLWPIYDDRTADFMFEFYQHLSSTTDKAQSLRQAMLKMIKNRYNPVDWAGFVLVGEADSLRSTARSSKKKSPLSKELSIEALKNAEYRRNSQFKARLINGRYFNKSNSIGGHSIWLDETIIREDLNNDGAKDAIVIINENTGGSGVFMELAVVINNDGKPSHTDSFYLGDRVRISDVRIEPNGKISLTVTQRYGPIEKMTFQIKEKANKKIHRGSKPNPIYCYHELFEDRHLPCLKIAKDN